jgi:hypothetical protein
MSPAAATLTRHAPIGAGLPPIGGILFAIYRFAWPVLAAAAVAVPLLAIVAPGGRLGIDALRLVKAAVLIAVSAILYRRRRQDAVAAMLSVAFLLWTISSSFDFAASSGSAWLAALDRFRFLFFALAMLLFPNGEWRPAWSRKVAAAIVAIFLIGVAEATALLSTRLYLPLAIACVLCAMAALLQRFRASRQVAERQQLKWIALGLAGGIGMILTARAGAAFAGQGVLPLFPPLLLEGVFQLGIVVVALGFLTSLLRYRLYDAEAAISRSAAYAALTLALVATFAASEAILQMLGQRYFGAGVGDLSGAIAAAIAAILLTPLHSRITGWAEQRFQRDLAVLKQQLPELLAELAVSATARQVANAVLPRIDEAIHAARTAIVIDRAIVGVHGIEAHDARTWIRQWRPDPDGLFERDPGDRMFPVRMALRCPFGSVRGWLLLGPRPDGSLYGQDELEALAEIAPPLRRALLAARHREQEKAREAKRRRAVARMIGELSARIDRFESGQSGRRAS